MHEPPDTIERWSISRTDDNVPPRRINLVNWILMHKSFRLYFILFTSRAAVLDIGLWITEFLPPMMTACENEVSFIDWFHKTGFIPPPPPPVVPHPRPMHPYPHPQYPPPSTKLLMSTKIACLSIKSPIAEDLISIDKTLNQLDHARNLEIYSIL